ncbi:SDR family oxidoreductase [Dyadobacter chenwenxiniae]|uniref:SDR family oxidoreductase n=1 Tax=Dyadobacter chenwenxiniae TaxID=2906456 RepID=A0A9X1THQ2_9BACT|nr:SDR family oxidoreductase [Dyadobacter chenwenxiniae]MCF0064719.1 SDR family oxidoreductase [Dyadobacter chenwenxiniae]UON84227.1 SDR family oxidoreductase [Dyadobacter chenwenxiniae]
MILITGATGHFGRLTINHLLTKGTHPGEITALARNAEKASDLKELGVKIVVADFDDIDAMKNALIGVDKLLLVSAVDLSKRYLQHENVIGAAIAAKVKHIIYTSGARKSDDPNSFLYDFMEAHIKTEQLLYKSGLDYTILRNGLYMELIPAFIGDVISSKTIYLPAQTGEVAVALRSEMAEAAASVLLSSGHEKKTYNLVNTKAYNYSDVAGIISDITNEPIQYVSPTKQDFLDALLQAGIAIPQEYVNILIGQANGEADLVSQDLVRLLGREPTILKSYLAEQYA